MYYTEQFNKLLDAVKGLPPQALAGFSEPSLVFLIEGICDPFELTMGEIGEICELVRQIITKEREPKNFEVGLAEKLDEDNREKIPQIVSLMSEKIFSKLLPALGIKVPIEFAVKVGVPKVEGLETPPIAPTRPAPVPRTIPPSASVPPPPVAGSVLHQNYQAPTPRPAYQGETLIKPDLKPPLMETSHDSMAINPLESLMQMLGGKVSQKDLSRQFEKLPESLKSALGSVDSAKKIVDIGRKYALHMDKLGELGAETGMVILGFTHPGEFLSRLTKRLGLPEEKVRPIAQEINTEVFLKIREALKQVHGENDEQKTPIVTNASVPVKQVTRQPEKPPKKSGRYGQNQTISASPIPIKKPENDLHPSEPDEVLDREAILRDIENPTPVQFGSQTGTVGTAKPNTIPSVNNVSPKNIPVKTPEPTRPVTSAASIPKEIPKKAFASQSIPSQTPTQSLKTEPRKIETLVQPSATPVAPPAIPITSSPSELSGIGGEKLGRQAKAAPIKPQNIIDQKLSGTTTSTKSDSSYTSDPYREAAE